MLTAQAAEAAPYTAFLGLEIVSASPDEVRSRLAWDAAKCTTGGMLHGGALMSLADSAGGLLAFLNLPAGSARHRDDRVEDELLRAARRPATCTA